MSKLIIEFKSERESIRDVLKDLKEFVSNIEDDTERLLDEIKDEDLMGSCLYDSNYKMELEVE